VSRAVSLLCALVLGACETAPKVDPVAIAKGHLADLHMVILTFEQKNDRFPTAAEVHQAVIDIGWGDAFLKDPWGHFYHYRSQARRDPTTIELCSRGPDGELDTPDDICVLNPAARNGEPLRFGSMPR
jgi:hypothetical protein